MDPADSAILQTVALESRWPTLDPFLFCVHHHDAYPNGNEQLGPATSLAGHEPGSDFAGIDGWRMYHGTSVPGFPQHPHRGFETVTYVRNGVVDHSDSLGATARFGRGDTQWLTAGRGIVHCEMFPLLDADRPNPLELFQIWLNLAPADKFAEPHFTMLWDGETPRLVHVDDAGLTTEVTVIAGALAGVTPASPPPNSWARNPHADLAIWHLRFDPGARWTMPAALHEDTVRSLYAFVGGSLFADNFKIGSNTGAVLRCDRAVELSSPNGGECLVLQGVPIGQPVAQYGPFVMNTAEQISEAFHDYQRTEFGGWPWSSDEPVHSRRQERFARHPDGRIERPSTARPV